MKMGTLLKGKLRARDRERELYGAHVQVDGKTVFGYCSVSVRTCVFFVKVPFMSRANKVFSN